MLFLEFNIGTWTFHLFRKKLTFVVFAVLFNIYGPRADSNDTERVEFKHKFYGILKVNSGFIIVPC